MFSFYVFIFSIVSSYAQVSPPYNAVEVTKDRKATMPNIAEQCGLLVDSGAIVKKNKKSFLKYDKASGKEKAGYPFCETPFLQENSIVVKSGYKRCSGCLIAPDLFLTAGHCLGEGDSITKARADCKNKHLVLNFSRSNARPTIDQPDLLSLNSDDVYECSEVLLFSNPNLVDNTATVGISQGQDFALIKLNRKTPHQGLAIRRSGTAENKSVISYIHPWGRQTIESHGKILTRTTRSRKQNYNLNLGYMDNGASGGILVGADSRVAECILSTGLLSPKFELDEAKSCIKYRNHSRFEFPTYYASEVSCIRQACPKGSITKPKDYVFNPDDFSQPDSPIGYCQGSNYCYRKNGEVSLPDFSQAEGLAIEKRVKNTVNESLNPTCTPLEDIYKRLDPYIRKSRKASNPFPSVLIKEDNSTIVE